MHIFLEVRILQDGLCISFVARRYTRKHFTPYGVQGTSKSMYIRWLTGLVFSMRCQALEKRLVQQSQRYESWCAKVPTHQNLVKTRDNGESLVLNLPCLVCFRVRESPEA